MLYHPQQSTSWLDVITVIRTHVERTEDTKLAQRLEMLVSYDNLKRVTFFQAEGAAKHHGTP